jgi:hypothetical protein
MFADPDDVNIGILDYHHSDNSMRFIVNNAEAMRINSSGHVMVGTTTYNGPVNASSGDYGAAIWEGGLIAAGTNASEALALNRMGSDGDIAMFKRSGSTIGSIGVLNSNNLTISGTVADHGGLQFGTHCVIPMEANVDSNGTINLGSADSKFKDLYLSGGIQFDSRSNKLDDYEEGTWTPSILVENAGAAGITVNHATYTKIGRLVSLVFDVTINSVTGTNSSRAIQLEGMPFIINTAGGGGPNIGYTNLINSMTGNLALQGRLNTRYRIVNLNGATGQNASDHIQANTVLRGQFTYHTDQ